MNKFFRIYLELKEQIENKKYKANSILPSENELARKYNVSRETIRKALLLLLENGYIHKIQGKGSIVLDVHRYRLPVTGLLSFKERHQLQDLEVTTKVLVNEEIEAPDFLIKLGVVKPGEKLTYLLRQRIVNGEAVILDKDYISKNTIGNLPTKRVEDQTYIDLNGHHHIAVLRSDVYTEGTDFLHYNESRHRVDNFYFSEFARRVVNKNN